MKRVVTAWAMGLACGGLALAACGSGDGSHGAPTTAGSAPGGSTTAVSAAGQPGRSGVRVWFLNQHHAATGTEPVFEPVRREVERPAVAAGALHALFAGPTAAERATGLRLITSGATGYSRLHVHDGIAEVTLEGGCSSGGSTMTVAGEITPTLKQFSSVTYVKIHAPDGTTEAPTGPTDSIPTCLEP